MVRNLVALGADVNARVNGLTLLHLVVTWCESPHSKNMAKALVECGASLDAKCEVFGFSGTSYEVARDMAECLDKNAARQLFKVLKPKT